MGNPTPSTSDKDYADLLARLQAIPAARPERRSLSRSEERTWEFEDLIRENGEATW